MPTITDITAQTKNINRANLFIDGIFYCGIDRFLVAKCRLKVGQVITISELDDLVFESDKEKAFAYALNYINRYMPTAKQLKNKLSEKGYVNKIIDYVLEKCKNYGYINDEEYARCYVKYNMITKGAIKIKSELLAKGISNDNIQKALLQIDDSREVAYKLALKQSQKLDLDDIKQVAKLSRFLYGRGFAWEDISYCIDELKRQIKN